MTNVQPKEMDIGELMLNSENLKSLVLLPEEELKPTGILTSLQSILRKNKETESNNKISKEIEETSSVCSAMSSSSSQAEEEMEVKNEEIILNGVEESQEKEFIDVVKEEENGNQKSSEENYSKKRNQWRDGLTFAEIRKKYENIIAELCIVKEPVEWTKYRSVKNTKNQQINLNYYCGSSLAEILHEEILDFVAYISPTEAEHNVRQSIITKIQDTVGRVFGGKVKLEVFGSFYTKLYLPSSDLDLVLLSDELFGECGEKVQLEYFHDLADALEADGLVFGNSLQLITKARVPLVKFVDSIGHIQIDISFNQTSGLESAAIILKYLKLYPALKPLNLIIKQFLVQRGLNEVFLGGLSSYGLINLIVSFLQHNPLIQANLIKPEENLGVLLLDFFEYYGKFFNNDRVGIRLANSGEYFVRGRLGVFLQQDQIPKKDSLSIQDPQDDDNDITRGSFNYRAIKKSFISGYNVLSGAMFEVYDKHRIEMLENPNMVDSVKRHQINDRRFEVSLEPKNFRLYSLLATIVRVSESMIEHRQHLNSRHEQISI